MRFNTHTKVFKINDSGTYPPPGGAKHSVMKNMVQSMINAM